MGWGLVHQPRAQVGVVLASVSASGYRGCVTSEDNMLRDARGWSDALRIFPLPLFRYSADASAAILDKLQSWDGVPAFLSALI